MFVEKGNRGYLKSKKTKYLIIISILVLVITGFLMLGIFLNGDRKNIYTIMAILTVLPMANLLTVLIAAFPYKSPDEKEYRMIAGEEKPECMLTELAITSPKLKTLYLPYVFINDEQVFAYAPKINGDKKEYEEYITGLLASVKLQCNVHIYTDMPSFKRIANQNNIRQDFSRFEKDVAKSLLAVSI